ncbi:MULTISPECIES: hypothetical protein [unclassified Nostoc]|uniref:hypothetical protein n=1 Tax=unclassified Nostoc TaxID=2593658 RepID=UPI002AD466DD|nr:hypothetical protein [Nostoc sp. DedQUE03]MDZ7976393.1 hypothetical protein [Nostoc sp. DedQUE03]MDZ8048007.1 hypothetical protein [Nostoc sp. DedQUE02]
MLRYLYCTRNLSTWGDSKRSLPNTVRCLLLCRSARTRWHNLEKRLLYTGHGFSFSQIRIKILRSRLDKSLSVIGCRCKYIFIFLNAAIA